MSEKTRDIIASTCSYIALAFTCAGMLYTSGIVIAGIMAQYLN